MTQRRDLSPSSTRVSAAWRAVETAADRESAQLAAERPARKASAPDFAHPWAVSRMELATALGIAAGLAVGDHPVFVCPRADMSIQQVRNMVTRDMHPPGTMLLIVESPRLDTVTRVMVDIARRRPNEPDLNNVIVVTPASPDALEQALRAAGHPHPEIAVVQTTSAAVGEVLPQDRAVGRHRRGALPEGNGRAL